MAEQLRHGSGLIIASAIMQAGDGDEEEQIERVADEKWTMEQLMDRMGVRGFCTALLAKTSFEGKLYAMQA